MYQWVCDWVVSGVCFSLNILRQQYVQEATADHESFLCRIFAVNNWIKMLLTKDNFYVYAVGYSGLCMDHTRSFIFANCIDDAIYQFSAINYQDEGLSHINVSMIAKAVQFFSNYLCF